MITKGMMSSNNDLWETPQDFFDTLDQEFHFDLDVCANAANAKTKRFFSPEQNGLIQKWSGTCWMNPPYGRQIGVWVKKAYEVGHQGGDSCLFAPVTHRYKMVPRLLYEVYRHKIYSRAAEIW